MEVRGRINPHVTEASFLNIFYYNTQAAVKHVSTTFTSVYSYSY